MKASRDEFRMNYGEKQKIWPSIWKFGSLVTKSPVDLLFLDVSVSEVNPGVNSSCKVSVLKVGSCEGCSFKVCSSYRT